MSKSQNINIGSGVDITDGNSQTRDKMEVYQDGLSVTSKMLRKYAMGSGASAIVMGHILKLYKVELCKIPKKQFAVETPVQLYDRLVEEKTGLAKSTTSRYAQLASAFLVKKQALQQLIEEKVNGLQIDEASMKELVEKIGEGLEVTALYREYGILPEAGKKEVEFTAKTLKAIVSENLDELNCKFGSKAMADGYDTVVIVKMQEAINSLKTTMETAIGEEEVKAKKAKENRALVITKKPKLALEVDKAMNQYETEMDGFPNKEMIKV